MSRPGATDRKRILVVEDQEDVRRMLVTALQMEGHAVDEAGSAADGLQCLQQSRYHLVLSDYAMPGGTGTWMLHQATLQGLMEHTIALIVTAHPDVSDLSDGSPGDNPRPAFLDVIPKPLDLEKFLEQVGHVLASEDWTARDERAGEDRNPARVQSPPDPLN